MFSKISIFIIRAYQKYISPHLGARCRFMPTCSEYAIEALRTHGFFKGSLLAAWRILRCNPLGGRGYDPVPTKGSWRNPKKESADAQPDASLSPIKETFEQEFIKKEK